MIYIDLTGFRPSDEWLLEAWHINAALKAGKTSAERNQIIDDNRPFWSSLKPHLPYNDKCWYSEAKESVSPYEIEHFRPTKATTRCSIVKFKKVISNFIEEQRRDWTSLTKFRGVGYWWLAFQYSNYRNCGKLVNGIKSTRFPIKVGSVISYGEFEDIGLEETILLDPTVPGDPELITFDPDGKARPSIVNPLDHLYFRAKISIHIYGLNSIEPLVKHRGDKWSDCIKAINRANRKYNDLTSAFILGDTINYYNSFNDFLDFVENDIKPALDSNSEFSSVAKACILSFPNYKWIQDYVL